METWFVGRDGKSSKTKSQDSKVILQDEYDVVYTIYLLNKFYFNLHDDLQSFSRKRLM